MWRRGNTNCPRGPRCPRTRRVSRLAADRRPGIRVDGDINNHLTQEFAVAVKNLNPMIAAVRHVNIALLIESDTMWGVQLTGLITGFTPRLEPVAIFVDLRDSRIDVAITNVSVARCIPGHVRYLSEQSIFGRQRWLNLFQRTSPVVRGLLLASEHHGNPSFRIELDHHIGALIGYPNVVLLVDLDRVR